MDDGKPSRSNSSVQLLQGFFTPNFKNPSKIYDICMKPLKEEFRNTLFWARGPNQPKMKGFPEQYVPEKKPPKAFFFCVFFSESSTAPKRPPIEVKIVSLNDCGFSAALSHFIGIQVAPE